MRRMRISVLVWMVVWAVGLAAGARAAAPAPWLPAESYQGGKQDDARLDKTVQFWDTGVPAADVFAALTSQTGVALGFSPPDDENARICLNLYLNPKRPPTLRDLLVQIGWALDCAWGVEGEGEQRRYVLLSTSIGREVLERLQKESGEAAGARRREEEAAQQEGEAVALAKLQEIGESLDLSREEIIKRYKGKDNLMLLALLDPAKRAMAQFCLSLDQDKLRENHGASLKWQDLSAEQQGFLRKALEPELKQTAQATREGWYHSDLPRMMGWSATDRWDDWDWVQREVLGDLSLSIWYGFGLNSKRGPEGYEPVPGVPGAFRPGPPGHPELPPVNLRLCRDPRDPASMQYSIGEDLYRLLGERVPDEPDPEFEGERRDVLEYRARQQRAFVEQQLASLCRLSSAATQRLSALRLPAALDKPYALWQLQEAVAARSGMHIVSDSFWQPPRAAKPILDLLRRDRAESSALLLLQMTTVATETREHLLYLPLDPKLELTRWEWGDAGEFLRFRSPDRDVWRAARLPAEALETLHGWLAPHLPEDLVHATRTAVPLDPRQCGRLLKGLNPLPRRWGGVLTYGRPLDEREQWRASFRRESLAVLREGSRYYVWLSGLSDEQWNQARGEGLHITASLVPAQERGRFDSYPFPNSTLRIRMPTPRQREHARSLQAGSDWRMLEFVSDDGQHGEPGQRALAVEVSVRPARLGYLVPPPG